MLAGESITTSTGDTYEKCIVISGCSQDSVLAPLLWNLIELEKIKKTDI